MPQIVLQSHNPESKSSLCEGLLQTHNARQVDEYALRVIPAAKPKQTPINPPQNTLSDEDREKNPGADSNPKFRQSASPKNNLQVMPFTNTRTADDLLHWESQYIDATKFVLKWLKHTAEQAGFKSSNRGPEVWLREAAQAVVDARATLPGFEQAKWKEAIVVREKVLEYWKERLEPWDRQRYDWIRDHEAYALA
ncbi:MAG: hypothetical protein Q9195_005314 [Heterodermia aff. obscurata]